MMDQFLRPEFVAAFKSLLRDLATNQAVPAAAVVRILEDMQLSSAEQWGLLTAATVRVVLQHISRGFALAMPAEVVQAYLAHEAAGTVPETPLHECAACGLGLPRSFQVCPHCGGCVGFGAHSLRRSSRASRN